jgi:hypothetical protein
MGLFKCLDCSSGGSSAGGNGSREALGGEAGIFEIDESEGEHEEGAGGLPKCTPDQLVKETITADAAKIGLDLSGFNAEVQRVGTPCSPPGKGECGSKWIVYPNRTESVGRQCSATRRFAYATRFRKLCIKSSCRYTS